MKEKIGSVNQSCIIGKFTNMEERGFAILPKNYKNHAKGAAIYISHIFRFRSLQFSHSVMSNSLQPHELQHARPPCPSPTPGVYSNLGPLNC